MKAIKPFLILCVALYFATACKKNEVDMTLVQKTVFENADIRQIEVSGAWQVNVVADSGTFVELEYSAYLEPYLKAKMENSRIEIGFTGRVYPVGGSVFTAKVHTPHLNLIKATEASIVDFQGRLSSDHDTLNVIVKDASICSGLHIGGKHNYLTIDNASKLIGCRINGTNNLLTLDNAAVCKGSFETNSVFHAVLERASNLVTLGGTAPHGKIVLRDGCLANLFNTEIRELNVVLSKASEATVNATDSITGSLTEASTLYYKGHPRIEVECSDGSQLIPL